MNENNPKQNQNYSSQNIDKKLSLSPILHIKSADSSFTEQDKELIQQMGQNHPTENERFSDDYDSLLENDTPKMTIEKISSETKNKEEFNNMARVFSANLSKNGDQDVENEDVNFKHNFETNKKNNEQPQRQCYELNIPNSSTNFTSTERKPSLLNQKTKRDSNSAEKNDYENHNIPTKRKKY